MPGGTPLPGFEDIVLHTTCGNCQLVCFGDKKETAENFKLLRNSGCVVQRPDGTLCALPPEEGEKELAKMDPEHRAIYS